MGGLLNRSSGQRDEMKTKVKKDKRKRRHQQIDIPYEHDEFFTPDGNENEDPNIHLMNTYELWDNKVDQKQMMNNINDPPGAPRTYSPIYPVSPNNMMVHGWPSHHDANNSFYPINSLRTTPTYNIPYDPNQYAHAQVSNTISNYSPAITNEERLPKKVQFASLHPQQQISPSKSLSSTHSWHEFSTIAPDMPLLTATQPVKLSKRSSAPRPSSVMRNPTPVQASASKAIYVGIDHQATLAGRGETLANKRHRKNGEKPHSDGFNSSTNNHQSRSHTNPQHKHHQAFDSPRSDNSIMPSKSFDSVQPRVSSLQNIVTKSASANKIGQNTDRVPFINKEIKPLKSGGNRRQQSSMSNEIRPMKSRDIHQQYSRQHQQRLTNRSPLVLHNESSKRRLEKKHSNSPVMRIPLSTNNLKPPIGLSGASSTASVSRTRI